MLQEKNTMMNILQHVQWFLQHITSTAWSLGVLVPSFPDIPKGAALPGSLASTMGDISLLYTFPAICIPILLTSRQSGEC